MPSLVYQTLPLLQNYESQQVPTCPEFRWKIIRIQHDPAQPTRSNYSIPTISLKGRQASPQGPTTIALVLVNRHERTRWRHAKRRWRRPAALGQGPGNCDPSRSHWVRRGTLRGDHGSRPNDYVMDPSQGILLIDVPKFIEIVFCETHFVKANIEKQWNVLEMKYPNSWVMFHWDIYQPLYHSRDNGDVLWISCMTTYWQPKNYTWVLSARDNPTKIEIIWDNECFFWSWTSRS